MSSVVFFRAVACLQRGFLHLCGLVAFSAWLADNLFSIHIFSCCAGFVTSFSKGARFVSSSVFQFFSSVRDKWAESSVHEDDETPESKWSSLSGISGNLGTTHGMTGVSRQRLVGARPTGGVKRANQHPSHTLEGCLLGCGLGTPNSIARMNTGTLVWIRELK